MGSYIPKIISTTTETALKRGMVLEFPMAGILVTGQPSMEDLRIMFFLTDREMYFKEAAVVDGRRIRPVRMRILFHLKRSAT
jgi:hypothetical protein